MYVCYMFIKYQSINQSDPGVPGPSSLVIEGSGKPVPDPGPTLCSTSEEARASTSHPDTAGLMGVTLRISIAGFSQMLGVNSQMLGVTGAVDNPDVYADCDVALEAGLEARPTQPAHPPRIVDAPSGYPEDLELYGSLDTVNIDDILSVDVTPLSSISTSGMDATACPDMSVARSVSVDLGTSTQVDFDDRMREIQNVATSEIDVTVGAGAARFRNPLLAPNVGRANIDKSVPGTHPLTVLGHASLGDTAPGAHPLTALGRAPLGESLVCPWHASTHRAGPTSLGDATLGSFPLTVLQR